MIPVIDLFAGPGGLGEGFSSITDESGERAFKTIMSVEKDEQAHKTLRLRAYVRSIKQKGKRIPPCVMSDIFKSMMRSHSMSIITYDPEAWEGCRDRGAVRHPKGGRPLRSSKRREQD